MYTLREFRAKTKEAFDLAADEPVEIERNGVVYTLCLKAGKPEPNLEVFKSPEEVPKILAKKSEDDFRLCRHGSHPNFCKFSKPGKPCKA